MSKSCGEDEKGFPFVNLIYYPKKNREKIKVRIEFVMMIQYLLNNNSSFSEYGFAFAILNEILLQYNMNGFKIGTL